MKDIVVAVWAWMKTHLSPAEVCWLCMAGMIAICYLLSTRFVLASEFSELKIDIRDMRSEAIEDKAIMWYRLYCKEASDPMRRQYWDSYVEKQRQLEKLRGARVSVPSCEDV